MKILQIFNYYQHTSGEDVYFNLLIKLLGRKGHKVNAYTKNSKDIRDSLSGKAKIASDMFWNKQVSVELTDVIGKFKPRIAHFHNIYPLITPTAYLICKKFNIPIVQTIHNYRFMCPKAVLFRNGKICELCVHKRFPYPAIRYGCYHNSHLASIAFASSFFYYKIKKAFDTIDRIIFLTEFTRNYYIKNLSIPVTKTAVIPYFADLGKESISSKKSDYFLYAGRLVEEKGIIPLLQLFSMMPKLRLVVIGSGPLNNEVIEFKKYKNISIKGQLSQKDVFTYIQNALFTIFPSLWYDALPLTLIESYALGTPVIAPDFGVFKNLVRNRKTGIFFKYNDFENLRLKLLEIFRDKKLISEMSLNTKKEYFNKYNPTQHYASIMEIYNSLVK